VAVIHTRRRWCTQGDGGTCEAVGCTHEAAGYIRGGGVHATRWHAHTRWREYMRGRGVTHEVAGYMRSGGGTCEAAVVHTKQRGYTRGGGVTHEAAAYMRGGGGTCEAVVVQARWRWTAGVHVRRQRYM
jgi:hypothetical protein